MSAIVERLGNEVRNKTKCQLKDSVAIGYSDACDDREATFNLSNKGSIDAFFKSFYVNSITFTLDECDKEKNVKLKYIPIDPEKRMWKLIEIGKWYAKFHVGNILKASELHI